MLFSELVLQGVRNFHQMHRIPVGKGFSVFVGGQGAGKTTVVDVLVHLLNPDPTEPATDKFKGPDPNLCRVALLIDEENGQRYRLVQDLLRGSIALARQDPATSQFIPVSNVPSEILQYLSSQIRVPHKDILERLYIMRATSLPSQMKGKMLGAGAPPMAATGQPASPPPRRGLPPSTHFSDQENSTGPGFPGYQGLDVGDEVLPDDPEELRSQLKTLRHDLQMAQEVDDLQFELDGIQSKLFEAEQKMKGVDEASQKVEAVEAEMKQFGNLADLPGDFEKRVRDFEKAKDRLQRDLARLDDETEKWDKRAKQSSPVPLAKNRMFLLGLFVGVGSLAVGVAGFFINESLRWVALLDIVGFGIAVVMAIRFIDQSQSAERGMARLEVIAERREKLEKHFEMESSVVRRTMTQVGVDKPGEILDQYAKRNAVAEKLEQARKDLETRRNDPGFAEAQAKRDEFQRQVDEIEGKLSGSAGLMMGQREMERRIGLLEGKLQQIESGGSTAPASGMAAQNQDPYDLGVGAPPEAAFPDSPDFGLPPSAALSMEGNDPFADLMKCADDLFLIDRDRIELMLAPRASQYMAGFTSQAHPQISFAQGGIVECADASGGKVAVSTLPGEIQDLAYLSLKFTIIENASKRVPVPLILDDPFGQMPNHLFDLLGRVLANIGMVTQVVMFARDAVWAQHANASFQL